MRDIGKNIKSIRQSKAMTQDAMAEALFVTRQTISNYETGRSRPDLEMLLRMAEILETDINTIIYGPPIPQSKKAIYNWLAISSGILLLTTLLYFVINGVFPGYPILYGYHHCARLINRLAILPTVMFVLGWTLMHILSIFSSLQQLQRKRIRAARTVALLLLGLFMAIPAPYIIWLGVAFVRSVTTTSVSMTFPYIPVYQETFTAVLGLITHAPFVYILLGGIFWLLGFPLVQKTAGAAKQPI